MKYLSFVLLFMVLGFSSAANARLTVLCGVATGNMAPYIRSVDFVTEQEYETARGALIPSGFGAYALIWFSQDQVAILKIYNTFLMASDRFGLNELESLFMFNGSVLAEQVNGNYSRLWEITCKESFQWIDPRLKNLR